MGAYTLKHVRQSAQIGSVIINDSRPETQTDKYHATGMIPYMIQR